MVLVSLDENEIIEIRKTLESILVKDVPNKEYFVYLLLKWFKIKGISSESSLKIINPFTKPASEYNDKKMNLNNICNAQHDEYFVDSNAIEQEMTKFLVDTEGKDTALRIFSILRSLVPQKNSSIHRLFHPILTVVFMVLCLMMVR